MLDKKGRALVGLAGGREICILPQMGNRHGLITGATGTGKSVSLQVLAETFSALGVPVFLADVKGDLSGMAKKGGRSEKIAERARQLGLDALGYAPRAFPVCLWDVFGRQGHPMRATISETGPVLLSRLLQLSDVQSGVLQMVFRIADDSGLLLLDLKDLRSMVRFVGEERDSFKAAYGQISTASIGAIQRALLRLEEEGGDSFFGEPALDVMDLLDTGPDGAGVINILAAGELVNSPALYSCVLLWLLSELFERLPEVGDQEKPRLVFFFDEAHLLFRDANPALLEKIEQVTRLIRSRGVGIFYVSQNPADMPDSILGQLGNRVQHALRAFTPKDRKAVRAAAQAFRENPAFSTEEAIGSLGVGEALVSLLDESGAPAVVERCLIVPPEGQVGPLGPDERAAALLGSRAGKAYDRPVDRESAYEILEERARQKDLGEQEAARRKALDKEANERQKAETAARREAARQRRENPDIGDILDSVVRHTTRTVTGSIGRELGKSLIRGILGGLMGGKR